MKRWLAGVLLAISLGACGQTAATPLSTVESPAAGPPQPTPGDLAAFAASVCVGAYERSTEGILTMAGAAPGSLVAICDYQDGTGDVVIVDNAGEAHAECSGLLIGGSRVIRVVQLP